MSERVIAEALGLGRTTVGDYLRRARVAGLDWPLPAGLSDVELERLLFPGEASRAPHRPPPDWPLVHAELKRLGVTLRLLWEEYLNMDDLREHKEALRMAALHRLLLAALPAHSHLKTLLPGQLNQTRIRFTEHTADPFVFWSMHTRNIGDPPEVIAFTTSPGSSGSCRDAPFH